MSDKSSTQSQQNGNPFNPFGFDLGFMHAGPEEWAKLETRALDMARQTLDELNRLAHATLAYTAQVSAEWRRMASEATQRAQDMAKRATDMATEAGKRASEMATEATQRASEFAKRAAETVTPAPKA
jgi:hypothetical protein